MFTFFEKPIQHNFIKDMLRLIRDILAVANDFLSIKVIDHFVTYLNHILGDSQNNEAFVY